MLNDIFTRENLTLLLVCILLIWRIIDAFIKSAKKRRHEIERLAFDMAKFKYDERGGYLLRGNTMITHFFFCLEALEKNQRLDHRFIEWIEEKEENIKQKINELERTRYRLDEAEGRLESGYDIDWSDIYEKKTNWNSLLNDLLIVLKKTFKLNKKNNNPKSNNNAGSQ